MCLIIAANSHRPSKEWIETAYTRNSDGAGIAWIQNGAVYFKKGLNKEEIVKECRIRPLPYIAHFRMASVGGKSKGLTHPFPVHIKVPLTLKGKTNAALFHNGHWSEYKTTLETFLFCREGSRLPDGPWSDTRAMAYLSANCGLNFLELVDHKVAVLTPEGIKYFGSGWHNPLTDQEEGNIWLSNAYSHKEITYSSPKDDYDYYHRRTVRSDAQTTFLQEKNKGLCECGHDASEHYGSNHEYGCKALVNGAVTNFVCRCMKFEKEKNPMKLAVAKVEEIAKKEEQSAFGENLNEFFDS